MVARLRFLFRALVGVALAALVAEAAIRAFYVVRVSYEPRVGYVTEEGPARYSLEGRAATTWLAHGVRFTPGAPPQGARAPNVVLLDDSFTEAIMIADDRTYAAIAQSRVPHVRIINAGRSRASAADYAGLEPVLRELFAPAWTVVELRSDDLGRDAWVRTRPHFVRTSPDAPLTVDPTPEAAPTGFRKPLAALRRKSMLLHYGYIRGGQLLAVPEPPLFRAGAPRPAPSPEPIYPVEEELDLVVRAWNSRLTILYLSDVLAPDPHERRVRDYCAAHALSCVFTRERNEALLARGLAPTGFSNTSWGNGHLNEDGHAVAGQVLAEELTRLGARVADPTVAEEPR